MQRRTAVFSLCLTAIFSSCAKDPSPQAEIKPPKTLPQAISAAAKEKHLDDRLLLTAAYVESNMGQDSAFSRSLATQIHRIPLFDMQSDDSAPAIDPDDALANARVLAAAVQKLGQEQSPADMLDWLHLTAKAIVGHLDTTTAEDMAVKIVLSELIYTYNAGFLTIVDGKVVSVPPAAPENRISQAVLNSKGRSRYLADFAYYGDNRHTDLGNRDAEVGEKTLLRTPKIILRWCPASTFKCFEQLRKTVDTPSHYLVFRGWQGEMQIVKFHDNRQDLYWYKNRDKEDHSPNAAENAITITLSGLAGTTPETLRTDWLDWEDYVGLRSLIDIIAWEMHGKNEDPISHNDLMKRQTIEVGYSPKDPSFAKAPDGSPEFSLPLAWDSALFRNVLGQENEPRPKSSIVVNAPENGKTYPGTAIDVSIIPDEDNTKRVEIFEDSKGAFNLDNSPVPGHLWQGTISRDWKNELREDTLTFQSVGATRSKLRSIKIQILNDKSPEPEILSSRILRFVVDGIAAP